MVDRPSESPKKVIYLLGPQLLTRKQQVDIARRVTRRRIEIVEVGDEEFVQSMVKNGVPEFVGHYLLRADNAEGSHKSYADGVHEEGVRNVEKYSGKEATSFEQFCKEDLI